MKRIDIVERKIKTAKDLQSIVKTMKGLAAVSISQYEHAADSISSYFETIEKGMHVILHKQPQLASYFQTQKPKKDSNSISIIFGSGQPMCGAFNEILASYFDRNHREKRTSSKGKIVAVGPRITINLGHYNWEEDYYFDMPTTIERINETVQSLVLSIQQWYSEEEYSVIYLYYNRPEGNASYSPVSQQLLPIDLNWLQRLATKPWSGSSLPTYTMNSIDLVSALVKQFLFVSIYKACAESLSAENNSRLAAMQVAEKKITEMIGDLTKTYRNLRQDNITEEILDIMASFEVLRSAEDEN